MFMFVSWFGEKETLRFTQYYTTGTTCVPSRVAFMGGRWPFSRVGKKMIGPEGFGHPVVTELVRARGYETAHFGKWDMGVISSPGTYGFGCPCALSTVKL